MAKTRKTRRHKNKTNKRRGLKKGGGDISAAGLQKMGVSSNPNNEKKENEKKGFISSLFGWNSEKKSEPTPQIKKTVSPEDHQNTI